MAVTAKSRWYIEIADKGPESSRRAREVIFERLFDRVIHHCEQRILHRIRPPWMEQPAFVKRRRPFLGDQLAESIIALRKHDRAGFDVGPLYERAASLSQSLEQLRGRVPDDQKTQIIRNILQGCASMALLGQKKSFESYLKELKLPIAVCEMQQIRQVDKLARYMLFCRDLLHVFRKPEYSPLFRKIKIESLESYSDIFRKGINQRCFVHAEMQQVLHYEQHPHHPRPRVIGCSKSACYLCDLFIVKQNLYSISGSHGRLYDKWTIPNVDWMTTPQVECFRRLVKEMIQSLNRERSKKRPMQSLIHFPLESLAHLPLSDSVTSASITDKSALKLACSAQEANPQQSSTASTIRMTSEDLPLSRCLRQEQGKLSIRIDELCIYFEAVANIQLFLRQVKGKGTSAVQKIDVHRLPTGSDLILRCHKGESELAFQLHKRNGLALSVDIIWE